MLTEEQLLIQSLTRRQNCLAAALEASHICVFEVDLDSGQFVFCTDPGPLFGLSSECIQRDLCAYRQLPPERCRRALASYFLCPEDAPALDAALEDILCGRPASFHARVRTSGAKYAWCKIALSPVFQHNRPARVMGTVSDISDVKAESLRLEHQLKLDCFLNIYNKTSIQRLIQAELRASPASRHALILFDLDNFKEINDTFGHSEGDQVLISVAEHLKTIFRSTDLIGRFGGDEFIVLLRRLPGRDVLFQKLDQILQCSSNSKHHVTKSIGAALFPDHATSFSELFRKADQALYRAKERHNTYAIWSDSLEK